MSLPGALSVRLQRHWWRVRPSWLAVLLLPVSWLYEALAEANRLIWHSGWRRAERMPVPVLVVGNLIAGGAGKTPTTMALLDWLRDERWTPGVVSRGYGRHQHDLHLIGPMSTALQCGDEPLLIWRRTGAPTAVSPDRAAAARALLAAHPSIDILVSDDGLQHWRLHADWKLVVFDGRGAGNGCLLPAGPLRQRMTARPSAGTFVLYNSAQPSTNWPGACATRKLAGAVRLQDWWQGQSATVVALDALAAQSRSQAVCAAAGIAEPERFFSMLEEAHLRLDRLPMADHASLEQPPWRAGSVVLVTEKDAAKLDPKAACNAQVWVVPLDYQLPAALTSSLRAVLQPISGTRHDR